jgi:hypothetical protein
MVTNNSSPNGQLLPMSPNPNIIGVWRWPRVRVDNTTEIETCFVVKSMRENKIWLIDAFVEKPRQNVAFSSAPPREACTLCWRQGYS